MRIFLDANVLFTAAHNPEGKAAFIIELGKEGYFSLLTSDVPYEEAKRNLDVKYPNFLSLLNEFTTRIKLFTADRIFYQSRILGECFY